MVVIITQKLGSSYQLKQLSGTNLLQLNVNKYKNWTPKFTKKQPSKSKIYITKQQLDMSQLWSL